MDRLEKFERVEFVDTMPSDKEWGVLYVSVRFALAICLCPDGCGEEAVMPLKPKTHGWDYEEHDGLVTLSPSIANDCPYKAHFYIRENKIIWVVVLLTPGC